jgi:chromodomain-helicase-DNA-binding protein 1
VRSKNYDAVCWADCYLIAVLLASIHKIVDPKSSEDISRILKRRGQKMFEQSWNQKKLEGLDIDSVLEHAEEHNTEVPEGMVADGALNILT